MNAKWYNVYFIDRHCHSLVIISNSWQKWCLIGNAISENYGYARIILFQYKHIIIIHLSVRVQKDYVVAFQLYVFRIGKLNQNENQKDKLRIYASNKTLKLVNLIHDGKLMQIYSICVRNTRRNVVPKWMQIRVSSLFDCKCANWPQWHSIYTATY